MKMDNQQATDWLCGFIDGEGSFRNTKKSGIQTRISNTDTSAIEFCANTLTQLGVDVTESNWKRKGKKREYELCVSSWYNNFILEKQLKSLCRTNELRNIIGASETTREAASNLYWLAGVYEAEGSFCLGRKMSKKDKHNYQPEITISNKRQSIINQVTKTLDYSSLSYHVSDYNPENPKHASYSVVTITGMLRVRRFLDMIQPLLQTTKYQIKCSLMLEFINSRLSKDRKKDYSEREHEIYYRMKQMI